MQQLQHPQEQHLLQLKHPSTEQLLHLKHPPNTLPAILPHKGIAIKARLRLY